jgi:hypothetical protein
MEPNPYEAPKEAGYNLPAIRTKPSLLSALAIAAALEAMVVIAGVVYTIMESR